MTEAEKKEVDIIAEIIKSRRQQKNKTGSLSLQFDQNGKLKSIKEERYFDVKD